VALTNVNACLRKLVGAKPDLHEMRTVATRILRDARRAAEIIGRIRSQLVSVPPHREVIDIDETNREIVALLRDAAVRHKISVRRERATDLPQIVGHGVQLQQEAMNLTVNSIKATNDDDGIREIVIRSQRTESEQIPVSVANTGAGFRPQLAEQMFDAFFITKLQGTGMGFRISRSSVESYGGRLWAVGNPARGAAFHLRLPAAQSFP
jgi:signal transduction histidine kinase